MRRHGVIGLVGSVTAAAAILAFAPPASAAGGKEWGLHSGDTLGEKHLLPYIEAGWPGVTLGALYGLSDRLDIGGRFAFTYAPLYNPGFIVPGMELNAVIRFGILKQDKISLLIRGEPGIKFASFSGPAFGIHLPVGAEFGYHITPEATFQAGVDIPIYLNLTGGVIFAIIPPMAGPGFEYRIGDSMTVGINTRVGAVAGAGGVGGGVGRGGGVAFAGATYGFITQAYFGYKVF
jgi:hypothetical protein